jgi:predicted ester cyclase
VAGVTPIGIKLHHRRQLLIERLLDAHNRADFNTALACFAHPRYELVGNNRVYDGANEVRHYYESTRRIFPDLRFEEIAVHHGDDAAVCELWMSGTHLGSGRDFEATGRRFRCRTAVIFGFEGEQLVGVRLYYDTGTIARQLA